MSVRRVVALSLSTGLVALVASGAGAAEVVVVGATPGTPSTVSICSTGHTFFQDATGASPEYTTTAGVITSWSTMAGATSPGVAALRTAREGLADAYTITGAPAGSCYHVSSNGVTSSGPETRLQVATRSARWYPRPFRWRQRGWTSRP